MIGNDFDPYADLSDARRTMVPILLHLHDMDYRAVAQLIAPLSAEELVALLCWTSRAVLHQMATIHGDDRVEPVLRDIIEQDAGG